ncbi:MAG: Trk family potassium uptake protein [Deltaproteobacteria bacterium CG11_big_fil_rev_8_21_14_0_20_42_23]|nr:MAG: Trk family potassium uptake protein [Deltaproteobacteria bacterium CG11_big_fil_rev_8_21_14_0_20_42_23]PJC64182.1 MAG: Trk family potassium uptake protein [Deltaproteobacteria bacterium CG_4_9_14_0_2_um_filter_42_21]
MKLSRSFAKKITNEPARILAVSFFLAILVGTLLLLLPLASATGEPLSILDALFTATSAVCVTGLIVQDTATFFSPFGKAVILALIQVGGLGIMTISTAIALIVRQDISIVSKSTMREALDQRSFEELSHLMRRIIRGTFLIELIGGVLIAMALKPNMETWREALLYGFFHSVSAFCNAGFSLFSDSLMSYDHNFLVLGTVSSLVILGGLGFTILGPLLAFRLPRGLHARLVVSTTLALLAGGTFFFFFTEFSHAFHGSTIPQRFLQSFFHSAMARTAGFNAIDLSTFGSASIIVLYFLMFVGASPGSTGGGVKTSTFGILFQSLKALMKGRENVEYAGRTIPQELILKAVSITMLSLALVFVFCIILFITEEASFRVVLFEVFSAFGTVGLSLGLTPHLTGLGKFFITILMYLGRIGPVTLALVLSGTPKLVRYKYPEGKVMIG